MHITHTIVGTLAVLATAAAAGANDYFGLSHTPAGSVVLDQNPPGPLAVNNIGSSGQDGVEIYLGPSKGWGAKMLPPHGGQWPAGCHVGITTEGELLGTSMSMNLDALPGGNAALSMTTTGVLGPACVHVALLKNGQVMDERDYLMPLPVALVSGPFGTDGTHAMTLLVKTGVLGPSLLLVMPAQGIFALTGSPVGGVLADGCAIKLNGLPPGEPWIDTLYLTVANLPGNQLLIESETLIANRSVLSVQNTDSVDNDAAVSTNGLATMSGLSGPPLCAGCPECCEPPSADALVQPNGVLIDNLGSSGQDGVTVGCPWYVTWFYSELNLAMSEIALDAPLQAFRLTAIGAFGAVPSHSLGGCSIRNNAGTLELLADFTPIGGSDCTVEILNGNVVIGSVVVPGGPGVVLGNIMSATPEAPRFNRCGASATSPLYFFVNATGPVMFVGGGQAFVGDGIRVVASSASGPTATVASLSLLGRNLAPLRIAVGDVNDADNAIAVFDGLVHGTFGGVNISIDDFDGDGREDMLVANIGSSGQDGVSIDLGKSGGARFQCAIDMDLLEAVTFEIGEEDCPMCPDTVITSLEFTQDGPDITSAKWRHGNCCTGNVTLIKSVAAPPIDFAFTYGVPLEIATDPGHHLKITEIGGELRLNGLPPGEPVIGTLCVLEQDPPGPTGSGVTVTGPDGTYTDIAQIYFRSGLTDSPYTGVTSARLKAKASGSCNPCSFVVDGSALIQNSLAHTGLGAARLIGEECDPTDPDDDGDAVWIANIGSSGQDGASIDLRTRPGGPGDEDGDGIPDAVNGIELKSISDPDLQDDAVAIGWISDTLCDLKPETHELSLVPNAAPGQRTLHQSGFMWHGSTTGTIRVRALDSFGNLVGEVDGLTPGALCTVLSPGLPDKFQSYWSISWGTTAHLVTLDSIWYSIGWPAPVQVQLLPGLVVAASSLEVLEQPSSGGPQTLDFELDGLRVLVASAAGAVGSLGLIDETVTTVAALCPGDCASPADDQVNVVDFLALLGQWGTTGSCDLAAPPGIDIIDFLALLGAWGACP